MANVELDRPQEVLEAKYSGYIYHFAKFKHPEWFPYEPEWDKYTSECLEWSNFVLDSNKKLSEFGLKQVKAIPLIIHLCLEDDAQRKKQLQYRKNSLLTTKKIRKIENSIALTAFLNEIELQLDPNECWGVFDGDVDEYKNFIKNEVTDPITGLSYQDFEDLLYELSK